MKLVDKTIVVNKVKQILRYKEREAKNFICECLNITYTDFHLKQGITRKQYFFIYKCLVLFKIGKPINKIIKKANFYGRTFVIDKCVLAPRCETERVVEQALDEIKHNERYLNKDEKFNVLDLCCGSGIIGITIFKQSDRVNVTCADISKQALKIAKINAKNHNCNINIVKSNMFKGISGKFDFIVSNPPYISKSEYSALGKDVKRYDPKIALVAGDDGLKFYRIICDNVSEYLNEQGVLILEIGYNQKDDIVKLFSDKFKQIDVYKDYEGNDRIAVLKGVKKC